MGKKNQEPGLRAPEELLAAQNLVLEMIALGRPLEEVLRAIASFIDLLEPAGASCIFLLEPDGRTMKLAVASKLPESFTGGVEGICLWGACGVAAEQRERVVVRDIASDPLYENHRELALNHGLESCWATPILSSDGATLGVVGIYHDRPNTP